MFPREHHIKWFESERSKKGIIEGKYVLDVFDQEGRYIAQIPSKVNPRPCKNHKGYSIEDTDEGFKAVKRYGYAWRN
ncbi:MAG: hypothetical protein JXB23_16695 [Candidatus Aminicenantes bacterium]|nr:hypothetical protein [Candidatus Aminicenantes bacterium]